MPFSIIVVSFGVPRKIRELIRDLERAGFIFERGKGSHRKFRHPVTRDVVIVSGQLGGDARPYQENDLRRALANPDNRKEKNR